MEQRDQLLDLIGSTKPVPLAARPVGWPAEIYLRKPRLNERDAIAAYVRAGSGGSQPPDTRAYVLVRLLCDATGKRIFSDSDVDQFGELPSDPAFTSITDQAVELCGFAEPEGNA